jgi:hypothetical protein
VLARSALASATPRIDSLRTARASRFDVMPYQLEPALAVTGGLGCRMLIADDVGLGKTVQAGLIVAELLERHPLVEEFRDATETHLGATIARLRD